MKKWIHTNATRLIVGFALLVLPVLYLISERVDFSRLESSETDGRVHNGL